jgi:glycosyltransferase involved in cell wall biosynthesis
MKIAIIVNPLIPVPPKQYGGIERIVFMLIQELQQYGHDITLFANENSEAGCQLVPYREHENYGLQDMLKINLLTSKIAYQHFDLVHTFGRMSNIAWLMFSKLPKIVSYQLPPTISQVIKASKIARKHSLYFTACSNYIARQINDHCHVTTIYNGVNINDYQVNSTVDADAPFVFLGRIQKEKGTAIAIKLVIETNSKLIIAGNIPVEKLHQEYFYTEVKPYIDNDQIRYIGPVDDQQKNQLLRNARALLMPVTWDEPFGIVMAEALACGTPVIGYNRGAIPEVVSDGINGYVCNNEQEMLSGIHNIGKIDRLNCRRIAEKKFSADVLARQYENLYKLALSK